MKKITLLLSVVFLIAFGYDAQAQFGCADAVTLTDGYSASAITTPGNGGIEDWVDPAPTSTCGVTNFYWNDDVYLFEYTAGADDEEIAMTIFSRQGWNGIGIFSDCTGTVLGGCIDAASSTSSNSTKSVIGMVGAGQTVYIAVGQWGSPNALDFDVISFTATPLTEAPSCTTVASPANGAINVLEESAITWAQATGGATGYKVNVGTATGVYDVISDLDVGNVLTHTPATPLAFSTEHFVLITAYNSNGDAVGCTESSFTTRDTPPAGSVCSNPIEVIQPLPYETTDNTSNYGDDYNGSPGANCNSTSSYLNGDDVVYAYTPTADTSINISVSGTGTYTGVFVYTSCADIGVSCANAGAVGGSSSNTLLIEEYSVTAGTTYYIVISTWASPQSTPYTLLISENSCVNSEVTFETRGDCMNGPQFYMDVDLTSLGSANSVTLTDNQGSAPIVATTAGLYSFGPFPNETGVVVTVANDDDTNCVRTSASMTRMFCTEYYVDCTEGPVTMEYCYGPSDTNVITFVSNDGTPLNIDINSGNVENNWDKFIVMDTDGTPLTPANFYGNAGDLTGFSYQSTGDTISFRVQSDTVTSCSNYDPFAPINVTVSCATCVNPVATYEVISDCINGSQFMIEVDLTDLGSATSITISDNQGSPTQAATAAGLFTFGPYTNTTGVIISVLNDDDVNCEKKSPNLTQDFCMDNYVDCAAGPITSEYCYGPNDPNTITYTSTDGSVLNFVVNSGNVENGWDSFTVFDTDGTPLTPANFYGNAGNLAGVSYQSTGDTISFKVNSDSSVSCSTSNSIAPINVTVSCATCVNPAATYDIIDDCENGEQFLLNVNLSTLGSAGSVTISNSATIQEIVATTADTYQFGPFPFLTDVVITISSDDDINCVVTSSAYNLAACPPANDNCMNATVVPVNTDDTCTLTTPGTILEATPSGVPLSCGATPNDDVWFEFTAETESSVISLLNITGGTTNLDHAVYSGACGTLTEVYCSADTSSMTPILNVGETYYLRVYSFPTTVGTSSFDVCIKKAPANTLCETAANFCGDGGALYGANVVGLPNSTSVACLYSIPNPSWNILQIGESGPINIQLIQNTQFDADGNPVGQGLDVDFVLWGPFSTDTDYCTLNLMEDCPSCPNNTSNPGFYPFGNIVDCSYSAAAIENVTIANALEGEIYLLLVTNYSNQAGTIQINQTNSGVAGAGSTVADIQVSLEDDQDLCGYEDYELIADSPFADRYEWYADGFIIEGETGATLSITDSNTYTVIAYDDDCGSNAEAEVTINFYKEATANQPADMVTCDDASADEVEIFDLDMQTAEVLGTQDPANYEVTYYLTLAEAQQGINALTSPYSNISNPQTVFVRVEDVNSVGTGSGCFATTSFDLVISGPTPIALSVDLEVCDDTAGNGFAEFILTDNDVAILGNQDATQYVVSYYTNQADAEAGTNALASPYTNTMANVQTVWARVESAISFNCYSVVDFDLIVSGLPSATFNTDEISYGVCPDATVPLEISLIPNGYSAADVTVAWSHEGAAISGQSGLTLPVLLPGTYTANITFNGSSCTYEVSADVIEFEQCVIPQGISPNGDGINDTFDLSSFRVTEIEIFNRNGTLVYSKKDYTNEWYGQTNKGDMLPVGTYFYTMTYDGGKRMSAWVYINK